MVDSTVSTSANQSPEDREFADDLRAAAEGDGEAKSRLWAKHYEMLRGCAKTWYANNWNRRGPEFGVSLDGTDIVNVAYERLRDRTAAMENGRAYFFRVFYTECMRIVVDHYRKTKHEKGRGDRRRVDLPSQPLEDKRSYADPDRIFQVLDELEAEDARVGLIAKLKVLENRPVEGQPGAMRGLTNAEVAEMIGYSLKVVENEWAFAKAFLTSRLGNSGS